MIDHDNNVGSILKALDDLGIADNTFVMYGTDNGPHMNSWPDGAMTPFRSEKNTNWEGAYRVPAIFRWPGKIKPGQATRASSGGFDRRHMDLHWRAKRFGLVPADEKDFIPLPAGDEVRQITFRRGDKSTNEAFR